MDAGPRSVSPSLHRAPAWRGWLGPPLTLVLAVLIELLRPTPLHFPGPSVPMLVAVALTAWAGGLVPGAASSAIAIAYGAWYFLGSGAEPDPAAVRRTIDLVVGAVVLATLMGELRRRADRALRFAADAAIEKEYATLFEEAGEPILLSDASNRYVFVNRRACEVSGYAREELLRMRVQDLVSRRSQAEQPLRLDDTAGRGEYRTERELVRRDGTTLKVHVAARRLRDGSTLAILRDVTEEREALDRLQQALTLVRATLESTADGLLVVDAQGHWIGFNRRFVDMWGIPEDIVAARDDERALAHVLSRLEAPDAFLDRVRSLYATPEAESSDEIRFRDGRVFERFSLPQRVDDRVVGRVWSFRDVTSARRQSEALRVTERRLHHTEKMDAVGRLAGGIAHDFNNMLTAILGEADLLLLQHDLDPRVREQVENIRATGLRSAQLTRQLLAYARRQHTEPRTFAVHEMVQGLDPLIRRLAGRAVVTRLELPMNGHGTQVHADPSQIEQAVLNLVINAGDAMPEGGELIVRVDGAEVAAAELSRRGAHVAGPHVRISVIDTGSGIPAEARPYLFEPFFTTKPPGKGTGLGLASVHGIVHQAHGFIEVESEPGAGASFHVLLPRRLGPLEPAAAPSAPVTDAPGARVLVVDDDEQVRQFVKIVLTDAGYDVTAAADGDAALAAARAAAEPADLLLTDVLMPGTNGAALARTLASEGRARRVLFMSGYTGTTLREQLAELGRVPLVGKPFRSDELLERVRAALAAPPEA